VRMAAKQATGQFAGKVVIVTGSSSGIGQAAAVAFSRDGASVVIHGQDAGRLQKTQDMMVSEGVDPARVLQVIGSMEAAETPDKIHAATIAKFNRIDVLVNNAGAMQKPGSTDEGSADNLEYLFRANLLSAVRLMQLCMPELEKTHGCVVNVSSVGSTRSYTGLTSYGALKAALDHFTRNYAAKYGPSGVRINSLNPGPVDTFFLDRGGLTGDIRTAAYKQFEVATALRRTGQPSEMAECIKFLASPAASYVTGASLIADGGVALFSSPSGGVE